MRILGVAGIAGLLSMTVTAPASAVAEQWFAGTYFAQVAVRAADVNGDGRDDLVSFNTFSLGCRVLLSTGSGFLPQQNWGLGDFQGSGFRGNSNLAGDVNGDGRWDVIAVRPDGVWAATSIVNQVGSQHFDLTHRLDARFIAPYGNLTADVDADGDTDVLGLYDDPTPVLVVKGEGATFGPRSIWGPSITSAGKSLAADVTGDGRADHVLVEPTGVLVVPANPNWYNSPAQQWSPIPFTGTKKTLTADMDADGDADLVAVDDTEVRVMRSTGTGFATPEVLHPEPFYGNKETFTADVDADGDADLVAVNEFGVHNHEVLVLRTQ